MRSLGVTGGVLSLLAAAVTLLLVFTQTWNKDDNMWGFIRAALLFVVLLGLWLLAAAVGIWYVSTTPFKEICVRILCYRSVFADAGGRAWSLSKSFKAEMAFEIIASFFVIVTYVFVTSWSYATAA
jgi:hypothetical protein